MRAITTVLQPAASLAAQLARLEARGVTLAATGDGRVRAITARPLTPQERAWISGHKAELLAHLQAQVAVAEALEERAAIHEYEAGLPRAEAEQLARDAMRVYRYRLTDAPAVWLTLIAPGCELAEAGRIVAERFGPARVLEVKPL